MLHHGDCLEVLRGMEANSVDSMVTDPPYGWRFMGKAWDVFDIEEMAKKDRARPLTPERSLVSGLKNRGDDKALYAGLYDQSLKGNLAFQAWTTEWAREVYRVLKPGAHILVFCGPRTYHRMASGVEDAGFEVRDQCQFIWTFGSGFPKSLDIKKAAEKQGLSCTCMIEDINENLPNMPQAMDTKEQVSEGKKQNLRVGMQRHSHQEEQDREVSYPANDLHSMQDSVQTEMEKPTQDVLIQVQGYSKAEPSRDVGSSQTSEQAGCIKEQYAGNKQAKGTSHGEESSLEGRSDFQTQQGQLHRPEVCEVSQGISSHVPQGRLHHGTQACDGESHGTLSHTDGSSSSPRPQHKEQSYIEPGMVHRQPIPQTCGRCGKAQFLEGWGTALKPANEPILLCRKPLSEKTVAANVLKWGVGGLNIDASRVGSNAGWSYPNGPGGNKINGGNLIGSSGEKRIEPISATQGRFPANLILSHNEDCGPGFINNGFKTVPSLKYCTPNCAVGMLDAQSGDLGKSQGGNDRFRGGYHFKDSGKGKPCGFGDSGGASRFFYCAKSSKSERNAGLATPSSHPTVKPLKLMRYLIRLVTPPGGIVLDPFMGSGSTGVAALQEGFRFIGIEKEQEYIEIAKKRMEAINAKDHAKDGRGHNDICQNSARQEGQCAL